MFYSSPPTAPTATVRERRDRHGPVTTVGMEEGVTRAVPTRSPSGTWSVRTGYVIYWVITSSRPGCFLPAGAGRPMAVRLQWDPEHPNRAAGDDPEGRCLRRLARGRTATRSTRHDRTDRCLPFIGQIASSGRRTTVFLVGDDAHRHTSRGGTGMNTAIADGVDLGWKLRLGAQWLGPDRRCWTRTYRNGGPSCMHNLER